LLKLESNLLKLGYKFANPLGAIHQIEPGSNSSLEEIRNKYHRVPRFFEQWYDHVEYIDFSQHECQLTQSSSDLVAGLGLNCQLIFAPLSDYVNRQIELNKKGGSCLDLDGAEFIPTGAFASNCEPKGIWLPSSEDDPVLYDDGSGPVTMRTEIMIAINQSGFPFWEKMFSKRRFTSSIPNTPKFREICSDLRAGIVPMTY
jgi:hypothetical protein